MKKNAASTMSATKAVVEPLENLKTWVAVDWVWSDASAEVVVPGHSFEAESNWSSWNHPHHPETSLVTCSGGPVVKPWSNSDTTIWEHKLPSTQ